MSPRTTLHGGPLRNWRTSSIGARCFPFMMAVGCGAALFSVSMVSMAAKSAAALAVGPFLAQRWPQTLTLGPVFNQPHGTLSAGTVGNGRLPLQGFQRPLSATTVAGHVGMVDVATTGVLNPPPVPANSRWNLWPALPVAPYERRRTLRLEYIPGEVWAFEQKNWPSVRACTNPDGCCPTESWRPFALQRCCTNRRVHAIVERSGD